LWLDEAEYPTLISIAAGDFVPDGKWNTVAHFVESIARKTKPPTAMLRLVDPTV
jgi:hypothetical protein